MSRAKYSTTLGDEWDGIARKLYGPRGEMLMHLLLEANPEHRATVIFGANIELVVPDASNTVISVPAPWMR